MPKLSFDLADSKLHPPPARPGIVPRADLVDRLATAGTSPVISVVAPPGYGKTTLLAQWAERTQSPVGWISADVQDNDPAVLLTYVAVALHRIEGIDPAVFRTITASGADIKGPRRLAAAMADMQQPVSLVLDHLEAVTNRQSLDAVAALAVGLPEGSQIAIGSRDALPLPAARLRSQGGLVEVGVDDLSMGHHEASSLLSAVGVELVRSGRRRARPADRGLAGRAVPRRPGDEGGWLIHRDRSDVHRRRPVHGRLPAFGVSRPCVPRRGAVPHPHVDPRSPVWSAVRRSGRWKAIEHRPRAAGEPQPVGRAARPPSRVVPLPPAVP